MAYNPSDNQPVGPAHADYGSGQPSATSSLRRAFHAQSGSGLDTPSTVDEQTALLGSTSPPQDVERGAVPKGSSNSESCPQCQAGLNLMHS